MRLLLVDTFGLLFRSYYAFGEPLVNSKGEETSVLFGFFNAIQKVLRDRPFDYFACALDSPGPTFRATLDPNYKANRPEPPDSLKKQIKAVLDFLPSLGIPAPAKEGFEADDVIATLAERACRKGWEVEIYSGDKDLAQLVNERTHLLQQERKTGIWQTLGEKEVREKWGVPPAGIVDLFSLIGDTSDNVPGVKGIGPKGALKLLEVHPTLDAIYENLAKIQPAGIKAKLEASREEAFLSKRLVTVERNVPDLPELESLVFRPLDLPRVREALEDWEMGGFAKRWNLDAESAGTLRDRMLAGKKSATPAAPRKSAAPAVPTLADAAPVARPAVVVKEFKREEIAPEDVPRLAKILTETGRFVFDFETTGLDCRTDRMVAVGFALPDGRSFYVRSLEAEKDRIREVLEALRPVFESPDARKIGHNLKFEHSMLGAWGIELRGLDFDTLLAAYVLDPGRGAKNLEALVLERFGVEKKDYQAMSKGSELLAVDPAVLRDYSFEDVEWTWRLMESLEAELDDTGRKVLTEIDLPVVEVLSHMEREGVLLDTARLAAASKEMGTEIEAIEERVHALAGFPFNIASTKQLQEVLFVKMGIPPVKKTKTGFSTDEEVLLQLEKDHPIAAELLRFRNLQKLKGTYIDALPALIHPSTGRVHGQFNQAITATGRLSSSDPNLQNIPVKTAEGRAIRKAFIAPPGTVVASFDYSQVELRLLARLAGEEKLLDAFRSGRDIHRETAVFLFDKAADQVSDDERRMAKTINFSVIYGISAFSLAPELGVSNREAQTFINGYFENYPAVKEFMESTLSQARVDGFVKTHYGRKRILDDLSSKNASLRSRAERMAFNTVVQGTASDVIKIAMARLHARFRSGELSGRLVLQVHDELVFYLPEASAAKDGETIRAVMKNVEPFGDLLEVDGDFAPCWS